MFNQKKQRFAIRKTVIGVASVYLGTLLIAPTVLANEVSSQSAAAERVSAIETSKTENSTAGLTTTAETVKAVDVVSGEANQVGAQTSGTINTTITSVPTDEIIVVESPVTYKADESKPVGTATTVQTGQDGVIKIETNAGQPDVTREEPTETVVVIGTQPKVETTKTDTKDTTAYQLDETREYGDDRITEETKTAETTTKTTTYKVALLPTEMVDERVLDDTHRYITEPFYSIDDSQALPSDKIVIDKIFLDLPENMAGLDILKQANRDQRTAENQSLREQATVLSGVYTLKTVDPLTGQEVSTLYDVPLAYLNPEKLNDDFYSILTGSNGLYISAKNQLINVSSAAYLTKLIPVDNDDAQDDLTRYHSSQYISEGLYADMKANFLRLQTFKKLLKEDGTWSDDFETVYQEFVTAFETITQRYNNSHGTPAVKVDYVNTSLTDAQKASFEASIQKLPAAIRQNILKLIVTDDALPEATNNSTPVGISYSSYRKIMLKNHTEREGNVLKIDPATGQEIAVSSMIPYQQPARMLSVLLHELAHNVDFNSGGAISRFDHDSGATTYEQIGLSGSDDFRYIYDTYFVGKTVAPYYRDQLGEAFADSLGEYIEKKIFGIQPARYIQRPSNEANNEGIIALYEGDSYYEDGYSPTEAAEFYFAKLYTQLFEQPQAAKAVVDTVKTTVSGTPIRHKVVTYGAKPKEETTVIGYRTIYVTDDSKDEGYISETGGLAGRKVIRTTYILENNQIKAVTTVLEDTAAVDKIVTKGTKVANKTEKKSADKEKTDIDKQTVEQVKVDKVNKSAQQTVTESKSAQVVTLAKTNQKKAETSTQTSTPQPGVTVTETGVTYSRVARNRALPETGQESNHASLLGLVTLGLGARLLSKRKKYQA